MPVVSHVEGVGTQRRVEDIHSGGVRDMLRLVWGMGSDV